ncbi:MAG: SGNH/GDSL hydrolase family protein, partial [Dysgonomonas sp.]
HKSEKLPISQIFGLQEEIAKVTTNFKGYHTSLAALQTAYPQALNKKDFFAWVGSPYPGTVYKVFANGGAWTDTGEVPTQQEIDLAEYAKKDELDTVSDNLDTTTGNLDSLDKKLYQKGGDIDVFSLDKTATSASTMGALVGYYMNQTAIRGKNIKAVTFMISKAGDMDIVICSNINTTSSTSRVLKNVNVVVGFNSIPIDYILGENESIGFGSPTSTAVHLYIKDIPNPVGGGFYYKDADGKWQSFQHNLNYGIIIETGEINGDIPTINGRIDALQSLFTKTTPNSLDLTSVNYPKKSNDAYYVNIVSAGSERTVLGIEFLATYSGTLKVVKHTEVTNEVEVIWTGVVSASSSIQRLALDTVLKKGERIGTSGVLNFRDSAPAIGFISNAVVGSDEWTTYAGYEIAYRVIQIESQGTAASADESKEVVLYETDFKTMSGFSVSGTWNNATPAAAGAYLTLEKVYNVDDRRMRLTVGMKSNTFIKIPCAWNGLNAGTGASCFGVDFASKRIIIYAAGNGSDDQVYSTGYTNNVLKFADIPDAMIGEREYIIEVRKFINNHILTLFDKLTGESVSVEHDGWGAGCQHEKYLILYQSGGAFTLKNMVVLSVNRPDLVIVGDSITDGAFVIPRSQRYGDILRDAHPERKIVISARSGGRISDVLGKFASEYNIYKPRKMSVLIGANGGNTAENLKQLKAACDAIGCQLYLHYNTCEGDNSNIAVNAIIESLGYSEGCRLDIATALNNDPSKSVNPALYVSDKLHPNAEGNVRMAQRFDIDAPSIFS